MSLQTGGLLELSSKRGGALLPINRRNAAGDLRGFGGLARGSVRIGAAETADSRQGCPPLQNHRSRSKVARRLDCGDFSAALVRTEEQVYLAAVQEYTAIGQEFTL